MSQREGADQLQALLDSWPAGQEDMKQAFVALKEHAESLPGGTWSFVAREGVTNSLRLSLDPMPQGRTKPLYAMADAVPLGPEEMMLSVCFYAEEVDDPDELGDIIPEGLMGEDGYCFDMDEPDADMLAYLKARISAAHASASKG